MNAEKEVFMDETALKPAIPWVFEKKAVRTTMVDNEPWFIAKDVCDVLGIHNVSDALEKLDAEEKDIVSVKDAVPGKNDGIPSVETRVLDRKRGNPNVNIVSEPGLYQIIFQSRKEVARKFTRWVTHEVLPEIRRTGMYGSEAYYKEIGDEAVFWTQRAREAVKALPVPTKRDAALKDCVAAVEGLIKATRVTLRSQAWAAKRCCEAEGRSERLEAALEKTRSQARADMRREAEGSSKENAEKAWKARMSR
jgi:prophage antirepressor-like protein